MFRTAVTLSLVPEARGGPFVFWDDLPDACQKAGGMGFDAIEIFAPGADAIDPAKVRRITGDYGVTVAAVGTGAGWVKHKLHLVLPDAALRRRAVDFIKSIIDMGAAVADPGAPAIIGSMQGRWSANPSEGLPREEAMKVMREALNELGEHAKSRGVPLIYEPLNRYETNMVNTTAAGVELIQSLSTTNVKLLSDLFHMNIEEVNIADALRAGGAHIGHVHFVDSNRRPAGCGHIEYEPIVEALREINYAGYLSAEALPWPDPDAAAQQTLRCYREVMRIGAPIPFRFRNP